MCMVAIDLGKFKSYVLAEDADGRLIVDKKMSTTRGGITAVFSILPPSRVLLEASTSSEWVARRLEGLGHTVIVADPNFGPMYARRDKSQKTDRRDTVGLLEANKVGAYHEAVRRTDD